jgi:hypothetical protein
VWQMLSTGQVVTGYFKLGVTQARAGVLYPSRREAYRHA